MEQTRKEITSEEFSKAWNDKTNQRIVHKVSKWYYKNMPYMDIDSACMRAVTRALEYYNPIHKQKFTSSLYRILKWEINREYKKYKKYISRNVSLDQGKAKLPKNRHFENVQKKEDIEHILDRMNCMKSDLRIVIRQYYLEQMTLEEVGKANGYCYERARQKLQIAIHQLKQICKRP